MIEKLTKEQEARFPEFIKKWTEIGLCTDPADRPRAEAGIVTAYKIVNLDAPKIVWCGSPISQGLTRSIVFGLKDAEVEIGDSVRNSVGNSVRNSVGNSVRNSVWDSVGDSVYGQHDANWLGFYDYFKLVCGLGDQTQKLCGLWEAAQSAGWFLPHQKLCWISERHNVLNRDTQGRLHKDEGAALSYPDGWSIYALHGVRMKAEYVITPAEKLDPRTVLSEKNVDTRRELIRKVGVERMLEMIPNRVIDSSGNYSLLGVDLSDQIKNAKFLKMLNPSLGVWHVEGVHPSCNTVQQAINWRAGNIEKDWKPSILT